ncbi:alpha/beta hydrolase domain-containing protein [Acidisphaera sp. L21]|uniref:alpha/beta hydrolase domain-containing protein n=1 Tax=Acidisphaera sp. L21 TaxID=1641851 RepID=UPI00131D69F0|nr:alpha/beta hydrolase domain-containing protein [Acidisphaera sp. L21]
MITRRMNAMALAMLTSLGATAAQARVVRIVVDKVTSPNFEGQSFGSAGAYEKVEGHIVGEVDPAQDENRLIQDLSLAPRTPRGTVAYTADFLLLKPIDPAKGNGFLDLSLPNRGRTLGLAYNVGAPHVAGLDSVNPTTRADAGDGFLMRRGYSVLYIGWQADLAGGRGLIRLHAPVATANGQPITGPVRVTAIVERPEQTIGIAGGGAPQVAYPAAQLDEPGATLRHHGSTGAPWVEVPRADWAFAGCEATAFPGKPDPVRICARDGFDPSQVYELSYTARDPLVLGLGLSAIRDAAAFFRHEAKDEAGVANPLAGHVQHVVVTGESQDGNLMRNIVQLGFTRDEAGRPAFDGMMAHLSGKRTPITIRFGAPGATTTLFEGPMLPGHERPLTWSSEADPVTGVRAGLLDRCMATNSCPKIINTWTSTEYRQYAIAYTAVDPSGQHDLTLPPNVRAYFLTGSQHGTWDSQTKRIPPGVCENAKNNGPNAESQRALLVAMEDWVAEGTEPPPSRIATLAAGQLAAPGAIGFPTIPGVTYTARALVPAAIDFGPQYRAVDQSGILALPPHVVASDAYRPLVPKVDADGNETAGVRPTALQAPLGTYTGWNLRRAGYGAGELCGLSGSFIPLAQTKAERDGSGDPRLSIAERYGTHDGYVAAVRSAAGSLRDARLLLPEDADRLVREAEASDVLR